jgi:glutathione S-transferase
MESVLKYLRRRRVHLGLTGLSAKLKGVKHPMLRRSAVRLIGIFLSPFVRRVAVSLNVLKLPFEHEDLFVFGEPDAVRRYNPLVRIPALELDDGVSLVDSTTILHEIDQMVTQERRLTPSDASLRRRVLQTAAIALGCADKAQWAFYEDRVRPAEKVHLPWTAHNDRQVLGGFEPINEAAAKTKDDGWIAGTPRISQADVTTAVAFTFAKLARPDLRLTERFPELARFTERCEALPAFLEAPLPGAARLGNVLSAPFVA